MKITCPYCGNTFEEKYYHDWHVPCPEPITDRRHHRSRTEQLRVRRTGLRCPCECNSGGFCGGCGHAGCGRR